MGKLKVACLQILPGKDIKENMEIGVAWCCKAKELGADIALFPEMWSTGYSIPKDVVELSGKAISIDGGFLNTFQKLAIDLQMAIGITFLERNAPLPLNSICIFDKKGKLVLHYSKVHTCDFGDESRLSSGDDFYVADLDFGNEVVKIGAMICYDREFPESARILMLKGAEIVVVPNACPMEINRLGQLRGRSYENMMGIVTCNYPSPHPDCNGHSSAFDGVVYLPELNGSRDICIMEADESEGIFLAEFDLCQLRKYRKSEVHGNAYRKPKKYTLLLSEEISDPFVRNDRKE